MGADGSHSSPRSTWVMPDEREKFSLQEMVDNFDLSRVSLGGPIFDVEKLSWLNGQWLRDLTLHEFASRVQQWALNPEYMMKIAPLVLGLYWERANAKGALSAMIVGGVLYAVLF